MPVFLIFNCFLVSFLHFSRYFQRGILSEWNGHVAMGDGKGNVAMMRTKEWCVSRRKKKRVGEWNVLQRMIVSIFSCEAYAILLFIAV